MARGESGRIVLEIDPAQKDELYSALARDGMTLKNWFLQQASHYLKDQSQLTFFRSSVVAEEPPAYRVKPKPEGATSTKKKQPTRKNKNK
jgi:hypothetical protein